MFYVTALAVYESGPTYGAGRRWLSVLCRERDQVQAALESVSANAHCPFTSTFEQVTIKEVPLYEPAQLGHDGTTLGMVCALFGCPDSGKFYDQHGLASLQLPGPHGADRRTRPYAARRPLDDEAPEGYEESDRDYVLNNLELAVALLDAHGADWRARAG